MENPQVAAYLYIGSALLVFWGASLLREKRAVPGCAIIATSVAMLITSGFLIKDTVAGQDLLIVFVVVVIGAYIGMAIYGAS
jgi:membrane protein DedA with SNARE-associated domain